MQEVRASLPFISILAGTRIMLGVGIGLLLSDRIRRRNRQSLGAMLFAVGALTTIPLALHVRQKRRAERMAKTELDGVNVPLRERVVDFEMADETLATD